MTSRHELMGTVASSVEIDKRDRQGQYARGGVPSVLFASTLRLLNRLFGCGFMTAASHAFARQNSVA